MERVRVLLVEDFVPLRQSFRDFLTDDPEIELVGEAATVQEALLRAAESLPDVAAVDISLPGGGGIVLARALRRAQPGTKIVVLLEDLLDGESQEYRDACRRAGVDDCVRKLESPTRLVPVVKAVCGGVIEPVVTSRSLEGNGAVPS